MKDARHELVERFYRYVSVPSQSCDNGGVQVPSTEGQWDMAELLKAECEALGLVDLEISKACVLTGKLPARLPEGFAGSGSRSCRLGAWFGLADAGFFPSVFSCGVSFSSSAGGCVDAVSSTDSGAVCSSWLLAVCAAASVFPICSAWKADRHSTSQIRSCRFSPSHIAL